MIYINERKYIAVSIKHSIHDNMGVPTLWGSRTADNEERCFSGYTYEIDRAELYSLKDFQEHYGNGFIKCDEPVRMYFDYKKRYKKYDTVLVDIEEMKQYYRFV